MFFSKPSPIDYLIVGLGNPGKKYEGTRHNIGFDALEYLAKTWNVKITKSKFDALYTTATIQGIKAVLLKPQTFMNLSGNAVRKAADFYKVPPQNIIVLFDDISLAPGKLRLRAKGSAGGHNGIKSIIQTMGEEFLRVKIGVGAKPHPDYNLADWVLSTLTQTEQKEIHARYEDIASAVEMMMKGQFETAQNKYNG